MAYSQRYNIYVPSVQSPPLFTASLQMFGKRPTPSARPSLLTFRIDRPIARISSSLMLYRAPCSGSRLSLLRRYCNRMNSYRVSTVDVPESPIASGTSNGVTPCTAMKNDGVLYHHSVASRLHSLRQSERTIARDPLQHKRLTYPCYRSVNTKHQQRWTSWWYTMPSKHLAKSDK